MQAVEHFVQALEAGRQAGDVIVGVGRELEALELGFERFHERRVAGSPGGLAEAEDRLLGVGEQLLAVVAAFGDPRLDLVGGVEQFAGAGGVGDDLGVAADGAEPGDAAGELVDAPRPPASASAPVAFELVGDGEDVDGFAAAVQAAHGVVDEAVPIAVEVAGLQALFDDQAVHRAI